MKPPEMFYCFRCGTTLSADVARTHQQGPLHHVVPMIELEAKWADRMVQYIPEPPQCKGCSHWATQGGYCRIVSIECLSKPFMGGLTSKITHEPAAMSSRGVKK